MTIVNFGTKQLRATGKQFVYLKQKWQNDWTLYAEIHCTEATWCLSPTMPTAALRRDYGYIKQPGSAHYAAWPKVNPIGWYVKVVMQTEWVASVATWDTNTWYGIIGHVEDEPVGVVRYGAGPLATGTQTFHCYGLEKLLDTEYLSESWVNVGETMPAVVQLPIVFNRGGRANRSDLVMDPNNSYVFEGRDTHDPSYPLAAEWWSTYHIVDYLLSWAVPKESFATRTVRVPFKLRTADAKFLPVLDQPVVEQEGQTVLSILNRLIDRRRLRGFYLGVDELNEPNEVELRVVAWNGATIETGIEMVDALLPNERPISIIYEDNQSTTAILRQSRVSKYDQVVVRGARRTSTATFHVATPYLAAAWTGIEQSAYEAAASGVAGYGTWDKLKQQQRNAEVRSAESLSAVFSWFKLPDTWAGTTTAPEDVAVHVVFPGETPYYPVRQYIHDVVFESYLPLYEHTDYSGSKIEDGTVADPPVSVYRQPLVVFKIPTDSRWVPGNAVATLAEATGDAAGDGKNFRWSASIRTQPDTRTLEVCVSGEQQHVIAATDFTKLAGVDRDLGDFDYKSKKMLITATLRDNRYAEGKYPEDSSWGDSSLIDAKFGFVVFAGDSFRQDYVVPTTVLDVAADGTLITSNGGYARDDTDLLRALARITHAWWSQDRIVLTMATSQLTSAIQPGYLITTLGNPIYGYETINTVVSELRIAWPLLEENQRGAPMLQFTTGAGELDPMTLAPPSPKMFSRSKARVRR